MGFAGFVVSGWLNHDFGEMPGLCWSYDGSSRRMGDVVIENQRVGMDLDRHSIVANVSNLNKGICMC